MDGSQGPKSNGYATSGKIMLVAIAILFAVVVFMLCLHIYARWYLLRARRHHHVRRRGGRRRTHIVFYVDPDNHPGATAVSASVACGLDPAVLSSLPLFVYSTETHPEGLDCAVCLSEFEENEKGRLLPKCNHSFHIECIDMWFHSHSTCPLCRSAVEPVSPVNRPDAVVSVGEPEHCLSSSASSSSLADQRKAHERAIAALEMPTRNSSYDTVTDPELGLSSPTGQRLKSTTSRLQSLKRLLSVNRIAAVSTSSGIGVSCGSATELDIECGSDELNQFHPRVLTPR